MTGHKDCVRCGSNGECDADFHCATCYREMERRAATHDPDHTLKEQQARAALARRAKAIKAGSPVRCPECGSYEHSAAYCDMEG